MRRYGLKEFISAIIVIIMVAGGMYNGLKSDNNQDKKAPVDNNTVVEKKDNQASDGYEFKAGMLEYGEATRIVDGDTLVVKIDSGDIKVRLIGVNTPELASNRSGKVLAAEFYSAEAKDNLTAKVLGKKVILESDKGDKDRYGRSLRYLYLDDKGKKGEFINEQMLKEGFARTMFYSPNTSKKEGFLKLEEEAKKNKVGLWSKVNE